MMKMVTKSKPMKAVRNTASSKLSAFRRGSTILTLRLQMEYGSPASTDDGSPA